MDFILHRATLLLLVVVMVVVVVAQEARHGAKGGGQWVGRSRRWDLGVCGVHRWNCRRR